MSSTLPQADQAQIVACTISRDVQNFELLIEDMEAVLGESWGDLGFAEAVPFLDQPEAGGMEFIALALDSHDEDDVAEIGEIISHAKKRNIKVILITDDVSPGVLHSLLRLGGDEFVPYPLPEGELAQAIARVRAAQIEEDAAEASAKSAKLKAGAQKDGAIIAVHGLAGGTGATTLAVNLAWELATIDKHESPSVCLLDLDLQFGSASTFLDLPRREIVFEMLSDTESMDEETFGQSLLSYEDKLQVLTAPSEILPLDLIDSEDVTRILDIARGQFDYVIVDMPSTLVQWSETVLNQSHVYFSMIELDMRSAQNALRFKRALQAEELPVEKLRYVLNRAPKFTDLNAKSRVKRLAESLSISIDLQLPDGGKQITQANDHGAPLAVSAGKSPLRREIAKLAQSIHNLRDDAADAA